MHIMKLNVLHVFQVTGGIFLASDNVQKKCSFCGESISVGAGRCPYCGSILKVAIGNIYHTTPPDNTADNDAEGAEQNGSEYVQVEQNAEVELNNPESQNAASQPDNTGLNGNASVPQAKPGQQTAFRSRIHGNERPYDNRDYVPDGTFGNGMRNPLSNGMKVFLTMLFTILPGIGQLAGIITAIVFMNSEGDSDRRSFGVALLVACLIMFVFACIGCFILVIAISSSNQFSY